MTNALHQWFETHILIHEEALVRFLVRSWPNRSEIDDIRQEIYVRIYESAAKALPHTPKAFLFTTARHLLIDRARRGRVVSIEAIGGWEELDDLNVIIDEPSSETRASARQELQRLAGAFDELPQRCREVLWLRRVRDLPQKEVARHLDISEGAVEKALARAVQLLAKRTFAGRTEEEDVGRGDSKGNDYESGHGERKRD
jgi:RNA polymerase sigma-70 factor (ECF subfamily)